MFITIDQLAYANTFVNTICLIIIVILLLRVLDTLQIINDFGNAEERERERIRSNERFKKSFLDGAMIALLWLSIYFLI